MDEPATGLWMLEAGPSLWGGGGGGGGGGFFFLEKSLKQADPTVSLIIVGLRGRKSGRAVAQTRLEYICGGAAVRVHALFPPSPSPPLGVKTAAQGGILTMPQMPTLFSSRVFGG